MTIVNRPNINIEFLITINIVYYYSKMKSKVNGQIHKLNEYMYAKNKKSINKKQIG